VCVCACACVRVYVHNVIHHSSHQYHIPFSLIMKQYETFYVYDVNRFRCTITQHDPADDSKRIFLVSDDLQAAVGDSRSLPDCAMTREDVRETGIRRVVIMATAASATVVGMPNVQNSIFLSGVED